MSDQSNSSITLPIGFRSMTMGQGLRAAMQRQPNKIALRLGEHSRSYRELVDRIDRVANLAITDLGLKKGQNVAVVARNCMEYIDIVCGMPEAGVAVATVNCRLTVPELEAVCNDAEARVIFTDRASLPTVSQAKFTHAKRIIVFEDDYETWLQGGAEWVERPVVHEWETWTIPYTSGTTGKPKGVMLSHRCRILTFFMFASEFGCYGPDDSFLAITPMYHGGGMAFLLASLFFGGTAEILQKFDAETVLAKLKSGTITGIFMVPTHFHDIFALPKEVLDKYGRPPITTIISNAAPLPQALKEKIVPYFGETILHETYGSTENSVVTNTRPRDQLRKERCVGLPLPHTLVRLCDENGNDVPQGEIGEIHVQSPYAFSGYWNRPEETQDAFRNGWIYIGDMGRHDDEGYLYVVDRKKDMIISGAVNIYPREIEEILYKHPSIADCSVVGVPDEKWGERLKAFLVSSDGTELSLEDVREFCKGKVSDYKFPKEIAYLDALPRNTAGKILKRNLRDMS